MMIYMYIHIHIHIKYAFRAVFDMQTAFRAARGVAPVSALYIGNVH